MKLINGKWCADQIRCGSGRRCNTWMLGRGCDCAPVATQVQMVERRPPGKPLGSRRRLRGQQFQRFDESFSFNGLAGFSIIRCPGHNSPGMFVIGSGSLLQSKNPVIRTIGNVDYAGRMDDDAVRFVQRNLERWPAAADAPFLPVPASTMILLSLSENLRMR